MARGVTVTTGAREVSLPASVARSVTGSRVFRFAEYLDLVIDGLASAVVQLNRKQTLRVPVLAQATLAATLVMLKIQALLIGVRAQATVTAGIGGYRPVYGTAATATWLFPSLHAIRGLVVEVAAPASLLCVVGGLRGLPVAVLAPATLAAAVGGLRGLPGAVLAPATLTPDLRNSSYLIDAAGVRITHSDGDDILIYA